MTGRHARDSAEGKEALLALGDGHERGLSVDECLEMAGGWSNYQWRLILILACVQASSAAHLLAPIFLIPRLGETWQLSPGAASLLSSVFFAGYCVGVVVWAWVSDSQGRRPATVLSFALGNVSGIASFFAPNYATFVLLRFFCGVGIAGAKNSTFMLATEFAPPGARARVGALISYAWLTGLLVLVGSAWTLQGLAWRWLVVTYAPAALLQIFLPRLLPESPRFSLVVGESERARLAILAVFRANGRAPPEPLTLRRPPPAAAPRAADEPGGSRHSGAPAQGAFWQLWATAEARRHTAVLGLCQGVCTMIFYGLTFDPSTNAAAGDLYLGALLGALVELPAYMMLEPLTNSIGRRRSYCAFLLLSAASLMLLDHALSHTGAHEDHSARLHAHGHHRPEPSFESPLAEELDAAPHEPRSLLEGEAAATRRAPPNPLAMAAALCGRFSSVAAVNVAYIVAAELFPTSCRNTAVGWGTGCGRIGAILAPSLMLATAHPLVLFATLSLLAAGLVWLLPESVGTSLADVPDAPRDLSSSKELGTPPNSDLDTSAPSTPCALNAQHDAFAASEGATSCRLPASRVAL